MGNLFPNHWGIYFAVFTDKTIVMKPNIFFTLMLIVMSALIAFGQTDIDHVFSNEKGDSGQDYRANPKNDLHQTFTTIREVKLSPAQYQKITGKDPIQYKKTHPMMNRIRMTNREYRMLLASNGSPDTMSAPEDTAASDVIAVIADAGIPDTSNLGPEVQATGDQTANSFLNWNMRTAKIFVSIFSLLALLGMFLIVVVLNEKQRPHSRSIVTGLLAVVIDTVFIMFVVHNPYLGVAIATFLVAAISAWVLIDSDMGNKALPVRLATALGVLGVLGCIAIGVFAMVR